MTNEKWMESPLGISNTDDLAEKLEVRMRTDCDWLGFAVKLSKSRIQDAYKAWIEDLHRSARDFTSNRSSVSGTTTKSIVPDHFKAAAFLSYWLRRDSPIVDLKTKENEQIRLLQDEEEFTEITDSDYLDLGVHASIPNGRDFLARYANQYYAFVLAFELAAAYEGQRLSEISELIDQDALVNPIRIPTTKFLQDLCYASKYKNISPHALELLFRAYIQE
jgi:hypothetical protein